MQRTSARAWDWLSAALLFLIVQIAAARLVTTDWTAYLYFTEALAAFGTALGLALGVSRFQRRAIIWLATGYTFVALPWQLTKAMDQNLSITRQLGSLSDILLASLVQFIQRQPVKDPLFFVAFVCLAFWLLGLSAGNWLMRSAYLPAAILPSGIAILLVQIYDNDRAYSSWWLAVYILLALLLLGRDYYRSHQAEWKRRRVFINEDAWPNIFNGLFVMVACLVFIAWTIPASLSSWQSASAGWSQFVKPLRDRLSNAVSSLESPYANGGANYYGNTLALGREAALGDATVFAVKVLSSPEFPTRYYWRGQVYDAYNNGQWSSSPASALTFGPGSADLKIPNADNRGLAFLQFTFQIPNQSLLYAPSQPVRVDKPGVVTATRIDTNVNDVLAWNANPALETGTRYQVRAEIGNPTIEQLRAAGTDYPDWVKNRYLAIPDAIKPDIKALAEEIGAGNQTPYAKVQAVTNYLRANMQYAASLPSAPDGRDPLLWFLFDYKKGFCNYYASAEVLLLRSIGIPARLAVGFAQGQHQGDSYIVRRRDSHAWPEVYFPGLGWVEFEPTVSQDALARPDPLAQPGGNAEPVLRPHRPLSEDGQTSSSGAPTPASSQPRPAAQAWIETGLLYFIPLVGAALIALALRRYRLIGRLTLYLSKFRERLNWATPAWMETGRRWIQLTPVERSFAAINLSLLWLGQPPSTDATPSERAASLSKLIPSAEKHIEALKAEHESALFTPRPADSSRARRAGFFILLHTARALIQRIINIFTGEETIR